VQEFWKSVSIWRSYGQVYSVLFFSFTVKRSWKTKSIRELSYVRVHDNADFSVLDYVHAVSVITLHSDVISSQQCPTSQRQQLECCNCMPITLSSSSAVCVCVCVSARARICRFWRNLARSCISASGIQSVDKFQHFKSPTWRTAAILKIEKNCRVSKTVWPNPRWRTATILSIKNQHLP